MKYARLVLLLTLVVTPTLWSQSNIDPSNRYSWSENTGWMNWSPSPVDGVVISDTFLAGFIWAENIGWINLGDGTPDDAEHYENVEGSDFGVNRQAVDDVLFGLAWGENIGWINFGPFPQSTDNVINGDFAAAGSGWNFDEGGETGSVDYSTGAAVITGGNGGSGPSVTVVERSINVTGDPLPQTITFSWSLDATADGPNYDRAWWEIVDSVGTTVAGGLGGQPLGSTLALPGDLSDPNGSSTQAGTVFVTVPYSSNYYIQLAVRSIDSCCGAGIATFDDVTLGVAGTTAPPPRLDASGRLVGYAWAENIGWINLDDPEHYVALATPPVSSLLCSASGSQVNLSWINGAGDYDMVEVYRNGDLLAQLTGTATAFVDTPAPFGPSTYEVHAVRGIVTSVPEICGVDVLVPPVTRLTCDSTGSDVALSWTNPFAYDEIQVHRDGDVIDTLPGDESSYLDVGPGLGAHVYHVVPLAGGQSAASDTCDVAVPPLPVASLMCEPNGAYAALTWALQDTYTAIEVRRDGNLVASLSGDSVSYLDGPLAVASYDYEVTAVTNGLAAAPIPCTLVVGGTLSPVSDLQCAVNGANASMNWTNNALYTSVEIFRDGALAAILSGTADDFVDMGPGFGDHEYVVVAHSGSLVADGVTCLVSIVASSVLPVEALSCGTVAGGIQLNWDNADPYTQIEILRDAAPLALLSGDATSYVDPDPPAGMVSYTVQPAIGPTVAPGVSCGVSVTPDPVSGLTCELVDSCLFTGELTWVNGGVYDSIAVQLDGAPYSTLPGDTTTLTVTVVGPGNYELCVVGTLEGVPSDPECCTLVVPVVPADAPTNLTCTISDPLTCTLDMSWSNSSTYGSLEVTVDGVVVAVLAGTAESAVLELPGPGDYSVCLNAENICGDPLVEVCCSVSCLPPQAVFIRGDVNGDGAFNGLTDGLYALNFQFVPGFPAPPCMEAADADNSGTFNGIVDGLALLSYQFIPGTPPLPAPFPDCGPDDDNALGCDTEPGCP